MFYLVRVYMTFRNHDLLTGHSQNELIRVKADSPSLAISHVMAQDWSVAERNAMVAVTVNLETTDGDQS